MHIRSLIQPRDSTAPDAPPGNPFPQRHRPSPVPFRGGAMILRHTPCGVTKAAAGRTVVAWRIRFSVRGSSGGLEPLASRHAARPCMP
eukprot:366036-Chlamydomonas_euryale.AAC.5